MNESDLPDFAKIEPPIRRGRNVRDGYTRGWGLQFGDLREQVQSDPLYRAALAIAEERTVQASDNRMNIYLLLRFYLSKLPPGDIVEFGSYRGGSALFMARVAAEVLPGTRVYALDTFKGMPATDSSVDAHSAGDFGDVDLEELRAFAAEQGLTNLRFVPGLFQETAPEVLAESGAIRLSHIDSDIRSAIEYAYEVTKPYMVRGGYTVFDDALYSSCLGATEVVEEIVIARDGQMSEQVFPQHVFRAGL